MSSILLAIRSRSFRYVGTRCYNQNNQLISCPITRPELIALAVAAGLCVLMGLIWCILTQCTCACRRRRRSTMPLPVRYTFPSDPETHPTRIVLPPYRQFEYSSSERLVAPPSPVHKQFDLDHLSTDRMPGYLESPSTETLVEPARIHPAVHSYPRF